MKARLAKVFSKVRQLKRWPSSVENAATSMHSESSVYADTTPWQALSESFAPRRIRVILLLAVLVFASSLAVVWMKDRYRHRYIALQATYQTRDHLQTVWGQLLLEESTWAQYQRIEKIATDQLNMVVPKASDIRIIK